MMLNNKNTNKYNYKIFHFLFFKAFPNQSNPSHKPSPYNAQVPCINHYLFLI